MHSLILTWPSATRSSSETKGQSVGSGKGAAKVFKKGKDVTYFSGMLLLKEQLLGLCECLSVTGHKK